MGTIEGERSGRQAANLRELARVLGNEAQEDVTLAQHVPILAGASGFLAGTSVAVASTLDSKRLAEFHFAQSGRYQAVAQRLEALAVAPDEPTREEIDELVERWARTKSRAPGEADPDLGA